MTRRVPPVMTSSIHFNPHSPCGERLMPTLAGVSGHSFQSTLPLRGATSKACLVLVPFSEFQSTLPLRGATHAPVPHRRCRAISIHTPLAGSDVTDSLEPSPVQFQSTLPLRGATTPALQRPPATYFNPHSPCGERPNAPLTVGTQTYFNPHSPCGERLRQKRGDIRECLISIHTPLAGSDLVKSAMHDLTS